MIRECSRHDRAGFAIQVYYRCPCVNGFDVFDEPCECGCPLCGELAGVTAEMEQLRKWRDAKAYVVNGGELHVDTEGQPIGQIVAKDGGKVVFVGMPGTIDTLSVLKGGTIGHAVNNLEAPTNEA